MSGRPRNQALLAIALGAAAALGFAPYDLWPVTLACLAGWMWLVHDATTLRRALGLGWCFGFAHLTLANGWIQHAFTYQDAMPHWLGYLAPALLAVYLAVYPMLAAGLAWRLASPRARGDLQTRPGGAYVLVLAAAWIATEWLRATMLTGYPWSPLGVIWLPVIGIAQVTRWVGTYALSGVTVLTAGAVLPALGGRFRLLTGIVAALIAAAATGIAQPEQSAADPRAPRVVIVQPNLAEEQRPTDEYAEHNLHAIERLATLSGAATAPRLLVWPEGALRFPIEDGYPPAYYWQASPAWVRQRIAALLNPADIVLTGGEALQFDTKGNISAATNSIFAVDAHGSILARYDKAHLVPWGEYLPARPLMSAIGLSRLVPGDFDDTPGPGPRTVALPAFGNVGMEICYEIIFSGHVVDPAHRPSLIFNPSNDSWYGDAGPQQHLAQARLRAIEEGLPILRATPTGVSALIDANGVVVATIPLHQAGTIDAPIPHAHAPTLFSRAGNWMAVLVVAAMMLAAVAIRRRHV